MDETLKRSKSGEKILLGFILTDHIRRLLRAYSVQDESWIHAVEVMEVIFDAIGDQEYEESIKNITEVENKNVNQDLQDIDPEDYDKEEYQKIYRAYSKYMLSKLREMMKCVKRLGMVSRDEKPLWE